MNTRPNQKPKIKPFEEKHIHVESGVTGGVSSATYVFDIEKHSRRLIDNLATLLSYNVLTDLSLVASDKSRHHFHSILLASSSTVFRKTLAGTPLHFFSGELAPLNIDGNILKALQDFVYRRGELVDYDGDWNDLLEFAASFGFADMASGLVNSEPLVECLSELYTKRELTFCTLVVPLDGREFPCHASIVAASSPAIFHLFESHPFHLEFGTKIKVAGIHSEGINPILSFIYSSRLELDVNNVGLVMEAASHLKFPGVGWACADFISKRIGPDNAFGCLQYSISALAIHGDPFFRQLSSIARAYIVKFFSECIRHEEFLYIPTEEEILEYMDEADLETLQYNNVLPVLLKWMLYAREERQAPYVRLVTAACYKIDLDGFYHVYEKYTPSSRE